MATTRVNPRLVRRAALYDMAGMKLGETAFIGSAYRIFVWRYRMFFTTPKRSGQTVVRMDEMSVVNVSDGDLLDDPRMWMEKREKAE